MNIVLGGSRHIEKIPNEVLELISDYVGKNYNFLIGDASGSDSAFQYFFAKEKYQKVRIFSSAGYIRNNLGNWNWELIDSGLKSKSNAVHAFKDRHMCKLSNFGIMIWDCQSAGTLSNVIDLVRQGENCFIWVAPDSDLYQFDNIKSLEKWMDDYQNVRDESFRRLEKFEKREVKRRKSNSQPDLFS
jgi:hypothetical protein